jgi:hypothetical protein
MVAVLGSIISNNSGFRLRAQGGLCRRKARSIFTRVAGGSTTLALDPRRQIALKIANSTGSEPNKGRSIAAKAHSG